MGQQLIDQRTADRLLSGVLAPEDSPPGFGEVALLLQAARKPPTSQELAACAETVALMSEAVAASPAAVPSVQKRRRAGLSRLLRPRIAATLTAGALVLSFGGLAEAGILPAPIQHVAHVMFSKIGVSVPDRGTGGVVVPAPSAHPSPPIGHPTGHPGSGRGRSGKAHGTGRHHGKGHGRSGRGGSNGSSHGNGNARPHGRRNGAGQRGANAATERGLCNAWSRGRGSDHGKRMSATAFRRLRALAARNGESVEAFCASVSPQRANGRGGSGGNGGHHGGRAGRNAHGGKPAHGHRHGHGSPPGKTAAPGDAIP